MKLMFKQDTTNPLQFICGNPYAAEHEAEARRINTMFQATPCKETNYAIVQSLFQGAAEKYLWASEQGAWLADYPGEWTYDAVPLMEPVHLGFLRFKSRDIAALFKMTFL